MYCIFKNNQSTLFCVNQGSLEVSHSFIYHSPSFSTSSEVSTSNNNSFINPITYRLQLYNSIHCNADIPIEQNSLQETIRRTNEDSFRMTYERTINQTIRDTPKETIPRTYDECVELFVTKKNIFLKELE